MKRGEGNLQVVVIDQMMIAVDVIILENCPIKLIHTFSVFKKNLSERI